MNKFPKKILTIMMILITSVACFSEETLTLDDVRNIALSNSRTLQRMNLSVQSSVLNEKQQVFEYLPSLSLGASASALLWGERSIQDSFDAEVTINVTETVPIWNGGKNSMLREINKIAVEITRKEALAEYFSVLDSADNAYYGALEAQASLGSANLSLENSALALSIAEIRREGGMVSITDLLQAQADYESKKSGQNQAKRNLALALAELKSITRLDEISNLQAVDFTSYESIIEKLSTVSDEAINNMQAELWNILSTNNPDYASAVLTFQRAEKNTSLASKDYFPSLSAGFSTGVGYSYRNGFKLSDGRLSISASIPLDFWVTANSVQRSRIAQQQSTLDFEDAVNRFGISVQTGILDCVAQAASVMSSQKALEYAEKHYENVLELYRLSQNSVSDLSNASMLVNTNRNQLISAQYNFLLCLSNIRSLGAFESDQQVIDLLSGTLQ